MSKARPHEIQATVHDARTRLDIRTEGTSTYLDAYAATEDDAMAQIAAVLESMTRDYRHVARVLTILAASVLLLVLVMLYLAWGV